MHRVPDLIGKKGHRGFTLRASTCPSQSGLSRSVHRVPGLPKKGLHGFTLWASSLPDQSSLSSSMHQVLGLGKKGHRTFTLRASSLRSSLSISVHQVLGLGNKKGPWLLYIHKRPPLPPHSLRIIWLSFPTCLTSNFLHFRAWLLQSKCHAQTTGYELKLVLRSLELYYWTLLSVIGSCPTAQVQCSW